MRHLIAKFTLATLLGSLSLFGNMAPQCLTSFCNEEENHLIQGLDLELSLYAGYVNGESQELVLDGSETLSQLDWKIRQLWVLGGTAKLHLRDDTFHISIDGWNKLTAAKSTMVDRDYEDEDDPSLRTHISRHPDTHLKTAYAIDAEFDYDFYQFCFNDSPLKLGFLCGYKHMQLKWKSFGGTFDYESVTGFFDPSILVISFKETFSIPYVGLQINWQWNDCFEARIYGKFSSIANVRNHDLHNLRDIVFEDDFHNATYWIVGAEVRWSLCQWLDLDLRYSYEQLNKVQGTSKVTQEGFYLGSHDGGGCKHFQQMVSAGLTAEF